MSILFLFFKSGMKSFTLHERTLPGTAPKRVCCNLKPPIVTKVNHNFFQFTILKIILLS